MKACLSLAVLLIVCAIGLVNSQQRARKAFVELERAQAQARQLDLAWAQLQLEQTQYSKQSLIEATATRQLGMRPVTPDRTQYIASPTGARP